MVDTLQEIFRRKIVPIRFQRTMGLLGATTLGVGALMGAGIYVLIGLAAEEEGCNLIVMGYAGEESIRSVNIMAEVLSDARTDTILFKLKGEFRPKRIAVSLGSSSNLNLIVRLAGALADRFGGEITFLNILPLNYTAEQKAYSSKILVEAIQHHGGKALFHIDVLSSNEPLEVLISKSNEFDLLIVGTTKVRLLERAVVGPFASQIASRAECSVAVVRVAPPIKKLLNVHPRKKVAQINSSIRSAI